MRRLRAHRARNGPCTPRNDPCTSRARPDLISRESGRLKAGVLNPGPGASRVGRGRDPPSRITRVFFPPGVSSGARASPPPGPGCTSYILHIHYKGIDTPSITHYLISTPQNLKQTDCYYLSTASTSLTTSTSWEKPSQD